MEIQQKKILGDYQRFLKTIFKHLKNSRLDVSAYSIDHICYRVESQENYLKKKCELATIGQLLTEADVNGRPISTFKLHQYITYNNYTIPLIELPSPKQGKQYHDGLEHCEFVIDCSFEDMILNNPKLTFKTTNKDNPRNPDISLSFENLSVKFHHQSLEFVIKDELAES